MVLEQKGICIKLHQAVVQLAPATDPSSDAANSFHHSISVLGPVLDNARTQSITKANIPPINVALIEISSAIPLMALLPDAFPVCEAVEPALVEVCPVETIVAVVDPPTFPLEVVSLALVVVAAAALELTLTPGNSCPRQLAGTPAAK
jgi:hypothetical protein